ncbi:MAG: alpha/beta fold hydrolase [Candidatus Electrothrix sp. ATG2]|nr:alpha/beta fold hydrolase [Candidatus Electrothrix sp. ATG2]
MSRKAARRYLLTDHKAKEKSISGAIYYFCEPGAVQSARQNFEAARCVPGAVCLDFFRGDGISLCIQTTGIKDMKKPIHFDSQGSKSAGWLFSPSGDGPFPLVIMAHGLAGVKEMRLAVFAERFAKAGYACLVFDYRHFGESEGEPRQLLDIGKQHQDWLAAIEYGCRLPNIDSKKIVLWGTSLSGGHVLKIASMGQDVAAVIAQVPHLRGTTAIRTNSMSKVLLLIMHGLYDFLRGSFGLTPHYILASAKPDQLALLNAPGEQEGVMSLVPKGVTLDLRVAARFALFISFYSPGRAVRKLTMPVLIQVGLHDCTTPAQPAMGAGQDRPNLDIKTYEIGHFQAYFEPAFTTIVTDQLTFLKKNLGV